MGRNGDCDWLEGSKVFGSVVPHPDQKDKFATDRHPIQSLTRSDFEARRGTTVTYRVQPMYRSPAKPELRDGVDVEATTEDPTKGRHGIYFNRGAVASQAFSGHFQNKPPQDEDDPDDPEVAWLARGDYVSAGRLKTNRQRLFFPARPG